MLQVDSVEKLLNLVIVLTFSGSLCWDFRNGEVAYFSTWLGGDGPELRIVWPNTLIIHAMPGHYGEDVRLSSPLIEAVWHSLSGISIADRSNILDDVITLLEKVAGK